MSALDEIMQKWNVGCSENTEYTSNQTEYLKLFAAHQEETETFYHEDNHKIKDCVSNDDMLCDEDTRESLHCTENESEIAYLIFSQHSL